MKRIYMTLGLVAGLFTAVQAQKEVNLEIKVVQPEATLPNQGDGDTLRVAFQLKNLGPDELELSDTIKVVMGLTILGSEVAGIQSAIVLGLAEQIALGVGDTSSSLGLTFINGQPFYDEAQAGPNAIAFPNDAKVCQTIAVYGYDQNNQYFMDDFDGGILNNAATVEELFTAFSGNNIDVKEIVFGTGETDLCEDNGGTSIGKVNAQDVSMNVYPNPASDNINFEFSLDRAVESATIRIVDVAGRTVYTENLNNVKAGEQHININVSSLNAGMYMVELNTGTQRGVSKLTIK